MAYSFHVPFSDEPILISFLTNTISAEEMHQWWIEMVNQGLALQSGLVYLVMDVTRAQLDFNLVLSTFQDADVQNALAYLQNVELASMFVGINAIAQQAAQFAGRIEFGGVEVPLFQSLEDAHAYIAADLQRRGLA